MLKTEVGDDFGVFLPVIGSFRQNYGYWVMAR
jgi:hypothetical protein